VNEKFHNEAAAEVTRLKLRPDMADSETSRRLATSPATVRWQGSLAMWMFLTLMLSALAIARADDSVIYTNDFETAELGRVPQDMLVLDGNFSIKEDAGNKFLELPGAPLDNFAVQFGPAETSGISVSASIRSTAKGRRSPSFGIGVYGVAGFKLQVSAGKKSLEIYKDQTLLATVPFEWKSGQWTRLCLQAHPSTSGVWKAEGKAWPQDLPEPSKWLISAESRTDDPSGRPSLFGSPFSGAPIQFDNLRVQAPKR